MSAVAAEVDDFARVLDAAPATGALLIMRHSLREDPHDDAPGFHAPLTAAGIVLAEACGRRIQRGIGQVRSSPAPRCIDTALAIGRGAGATLEIEPDEGLREPGAFAVEPGLAGPYFLEHGARGYVHGLLQPGGVPGALGAEEGCRRLLARLEPLWAGTGLHLAVTHDTVLGALVHVLARAEAIDEALWPRMMEPLALWRRQDGALGFAWRGRVGHRDPPAP